MWWWIFITTTSANGNSPLSLPREFIHTAAAALFTHSCFPQKNTLSTEVEAGEKRERERRWWWWRLSILLLASSRELVSRVMMASLFNLLARQIHSERARERELRRSGTKSPSFVHYSRGSMLHFCITALFRVKRGRFDNKRRRSSHISKASQPWCAQKSATFQSNSTTMMTNKLSVLWRRGGGKSDGFWIEIGEKEREGERERLSNSFPNVFLQCVDRLLHKIK